VSSRLEMLCFEKEVQPVSYVVNCDCGYVARGETEDELVSDVTAHVGEQHPEMADQLGREQILARAEQE
jgi:predicted small metal-binding protein